MQRIELGPRTRSVLFAITVAVGGLVLLNIAFIVDALYQGALRWLISLVVPLGPETDVRWLPPVLHGSFVVLIGAISWFVFRTRLGEVYKATYLTVPVATALVTAGIFLADWPILSYAAGALLCGGALLYLYRTRQPWIYYYAVALVGTALALFRMLGGEI